MPIAGTGIIWSSDLASPRRWQSLLKAKLWVCVCLHTARQIPIDRHAQGDIDWEGDGQCHRKKQTRIGLGHGNFHRRRYSNVTGASG